MEKLTKNNWTILGVIVFIIATFVGGSLYFKFFLGGEEESAAPHSGPMTQEEKRKALESFRGQLPPEPMTEEQRQAAVSAMHVESHTVLTDEEKAQLVKSFKY